MRENGDPISEKTVGNDMRKMGIRAYYIKHSIKTTIQPDFNRKLKNILKQQFNPKEPNAVWCSDITYIWTYTGFVYLTSIMDLYSRKIIAWVERELWISPKSCTVTVESSIHVIYIKKQPWDGS